MLHVVYKTCLPITGGCPVSRIGLTVTPSLTRAASGYVALQVGPKRQRRSAVSRAAHDFCGEDSRRRGRWFLRVSVWVFVCLYDRASYIVSGSTLTSTVLFVLRCIVQASTCSPRTACSSWLVLSGAAKSVHPINWCSTLQSTTDSRRRLFRWRRGTELQV